VLFLQPTTTFTPTPLPMSLSPMETSKGGGKMKTAKTNTHYKSQFNIEEKDEVIDLYSVVLLHVCCIYIKCSS
jgi:hypothetical protein